MFLPGGKLLRKEVFSLATPFQETPNILRPCRLRRPGADAGFVRSYVTVPCSSKRQGISLRSGAPSAEIGIISCTLSDSTMASLPFQAGPDVRNSTGSGPELDGPMMNLVISA